MSEVGTPQQVESEDPTTQGSGQTRDGYQLVPAVDPLLIEAFKDLGVDTGPVADDLLAEELVPTEVPERWYPLVDFLKDMLPWVAADCPLERHLRELLDGADGNSTFGYLHVTRSRYKELEDLHRLAVNAQLVEEVKDLIFRRGSTNNPTLLATKLEELWLGLNRNWEAVAKAIRR